MKKIIILILLLIMSLPVFATEWGAGYNYYGLTGRVWWNETFGSGIVAMASYSTIYLGCNFSIEPINICIYKKDEGQINIIPRFSFILNKYADMGLPWTNTKLNVHEYSASLTVPEIEYAMPFLKNLHLLCGLTFIAHWLYTFDGKFNHIDFSFQPISVGGLGLIYYF